MGNNKSSLKRIRQNFVKKIRNRYLNKSTKTAIKKLIKQKEKKYYPKVISMIDKLSKKKIIHVNKASRIKSKLYKKIFNFK